jgi:hypothetical protein
MEQGVEGAGLSDDSFAMDAARRRALLAIYKGAGRHQGDNKGKHRAEAPQRDK